MINQQMTERGQNSSVIRELFEFGKQRKAIVGNPFPPSVSAWAWNAC